MTNDSTPADRYQFERVHLDYRFAGELDDTPNYINVYVNSARITRWRNGRCNSGPVRPSGFPVTRTINATSFTFGAQPEGDVDQPCGSIDRYGRNYFTLTRFRLVAR